MNDNYFILDGQTTPMSEDMAQFLRGRLKEHVPVARIASFNSGGSHDRIIIRLAKAATVLFKGIKSDVVVISKRGDLVNSWSTRDEFLGDKPQNTYVNIETLIEGDLP